MTDTDIRQNINSSELMEPQLSDNAKYIQKLDIRGNRRKGAVGESERYILAGSYECSKG
jgi:hypothetical protein